MTTEAVTPTAAVVEAVAPIALATPAVEVSRDTTIAADPAAVTAAEQALAAAITPESKAAAQAALDALKPPVADPAKVTADAKAAAVTTAEAALAAAKTPEEKAAATRALAAAKDVPNVAPEKYEAFELPNGAVADEAQFEAFGALAKSLNLSQYQAQQLVDFEATRQAQAVVNHVKAYNDLLATRLSDLKADVEIGGAKFEQSIAHAHVALKQFGSAELAKFLSEDAVGSHKEVVRFLSKVGAAMSDDSFVHAGGKTTATTMKPEEKMYPSMRK